MIRFENVSVTYEGAPEPAVRGVDFEVPEGELVLLVGPSGVGKSTVLGAVSGLVPHFTGGTLRGRVTVAGRDTRTHKPRDLADVVGTVGQDPLSHFVTDTVEEELAYGMESLGLAPEVMRRRVEETLDLLGLAGLRDRPIATLSGGQQQRVAIGSVLTAHPSVLVLDEPTSALDPAAAEEVLAVLQRLVHDLGTTILMAEHRLERVIHYADQILLLPGQGAAPVLGPPADVMTVSPVFPPVVALARTAGWSPLPLTVRDARRRAAALRERLTGRTPETAVREHRAAAREPEAAMQKQSTATLREPEATAQEPQAAAREQRAAVLREPGAATQKPEAAAQNPETAAQEHHAAAPRQPGAAAPEPDTTTQEPQAAAQQQRAAVLREPGAATQKPEAAAQKRETTTQQPEAATREPGTAVRAEPGGRKAEEAPAERNRLAQDRPEQPAAPGRVAAAHEHPAAPHEQPAPAAPHQQPASDHEHPAATHEPPATTPRPRRMLGRRRSAQAAAEGRPAASPLARRLFIGRRTPATRGTASPGAPLPVAEARSLAVRRGRVDALRHVDLSVSAGEAIALMGRNGAGKSTLLSALVGLVEPVGGTVRAGGAVPHRTAPRDLVRRVGLVPQEPRDLLYADTVAAECAQADRDAGAAPGTCRALVSELLPGVTDDLHPRDLSEGQRLSLALAVVLTARPPLLLLDEPTRGLDYAAKARLVTRLRGLAAEGHAIVLATHDVELAAELAHRVVLLADGEVIADGPAADVVVSSPSYAPQVAKILAPQKWLTVAQVKKALDDHQP
ncbi:ATP-binding cassette domain-containing protein [Streptomyces sp. NPDC018960]|uniref:ATP-binding cassette domain-containing protein n=1 Tax=unclassified Streptomyces TaxID=2593676 RepID=UPI003789025A